MGIHGFFSFLRNMGQRRKDALQVLEANPVLTEEQAFEKASLKMEIAALNKIFRSYGPANPEYLYIDANTLCYKALEPVYGKGAFNLPSVLAKLKVQNPETTHRECYRLTWIFLREMIDYLKPNHVYIAFDGPVNMAKMHQQKGRRYESGLNLDADSTFDTAAITPGTNWMEGLHQYLKQEIEIYMNTDQHYFWPLTVEYSSHRVAGEGEHKIMDSIRGLENLKEDASIVVFGQDSDIVLLCLTILVSSQEKKLKNIIICSNFESPYMRDLYEQFRNEIPAEKQTILVRERDYPFLYVNSLYAAFKLLGLNRPTMVQDFVFCISIIGNDFLPRPTAMLNVNKSAENVIRALNDTFPKGEKEQESIYVYPGQIRWHHFARFLTHFIGDQGEKEIDLILAYPNTNSRILHAARVNDFWDQERSPEYYREAYYTNALYAQPKNGLAQFPLAMSDVAEMCVEFLRGFAWTSYYYFEGQNNITWDWFYPYTYAPMLADVLDCLRSLIKSGTLGQTVELPLHPEKQTTVAEQLIAVMHPRSLQWIPPTLWVCWSDKSCIRDLMPESILIDKDYLEPDKVVEEECILSVPTREDFISVTIRVAEDYDLPEELFPYIQEIKTIGDKLELTLIGPSSLVIPDDLKVELNDFEPYLNIPYGKLESASGAWVGLKTFPHIDLERIRQEIIRHGINTTPFKNEENLTYRLAAAMQPARAEKLKIILARNEEYQTKKSFNRGGGGTSERESYKPRGGGTSERGSYKPRGGTRGTRPSKF